jgi:hypothetical protein
MTKPSRVSLYKHVFPPSLPGIAFIGLPTVGGSLHPISVCIFFSLFWNIFSLLDFILASEFWFWSFGVWILEFWNFEFWIFGFWFWILEFWIFRFLDLFQDYLFMCNRKDKAFGSPEFYPENLPSHHK